MYHRGQDSFVPTSFDFYIIKWKGQKKQMHVTENLAITEYVKQHKEETLILLKQLAAIAAPSYKEDKRAEFCLNWLREQGAKEVYIDEAKNVVFPYQCSEDKNCVAIMAHMDVVFPDTDVFLVKEEEDILCAPGIGDDTANLVNLLMCAKYVLNHPPKHLKKGLLFVANTCEEGLGNLRGCKKIFEKYKNIEEMMSFDIYLGRLVNAAVGSHRYEIKVKTEGGHSHGDFGKKNAIVVLADIIQRLYAVPLPEEGKTTYNVGVIQGGISVNTIAEDAKMYYEFRSDRQTSLEYMEEKLQEILHDIQAEEVEVEAKLIGIRPCVAKDIPKKKLEELVRRQKKLIEFYTGQTVQAEPGSTDANIPLSLGIPGVAFGTVSGGGAHTYEEWIEKDSMITGQKLALASVLQYEETFV